MRLAVPVVLAALAASALMADAHVVAAVGDNNRYIKLSVLGDRVRLAYTIFYGEVPGAALRKQIDVDHNGEINDAETTPFGSQIADDVAKAISLEIDGVPVRPAWNAVLVGMGTPSASAGAFSIDLIGAACLPTRGTHKLRFRDHYALDRPGETEVKLEDGPGIKIDSSHIGDADDEAHDYNLVGPSGALDTHGLEAQVTIDARAVATPDDVCPDPNAPPKRHPTMPMGEYLLAITGVIIGPPALILAIIIVRRRRRQAELARIAAGKIPRKLR